MTKCDVGSYCWWVFSRNPRGMVRQGKGLPTQLTTCWFDMVEGGRKRECSCFSLLFFLFLFFSKSKKPIKYQRRTTDDNGRLSLAYHVEGRSGSEMRRGKIATKPAPDPTTKIRPSDSLKKKSSRRCERQLLIPCDARFDPGTATTGGFGSDGGCLGRVWRGKVALPRAKWTATGC